MILIFFLVLLVIFYFYLLIKKVENKLLNMIAAVYVLFGLYFIFLIDEVNSYILFLVWGCGLSQLERIEKFLRNIKK